MTDTEKEIEEVCGIIDRAVSVRNDCVFGVYDAAENVVNAGYRKADKVSEELKNALSDAIHSFTRMETLYKLKCNEIAGLTGKVEALQKDNENLRRTLEEGRETVDEAKRKTAEDIVDLLIQYDDGDSNTEAVELIVERYGLQDYIKENFFVLDGEDYE